MAYIKRDLEDKVLSLSEEYSAILITGPRQVGKTTILRQLMDSSREYVTLDDLNVPALRDLWTTAFMNCSYLI